ncbi:MAG: cysteine--tRNA ligase [Alphaproteobacteria bacterium]|nr:cysteine--tRNA ligase [Alphaproteobacteria bacterium]
MTLQFHNTLARRREALVPLDPSRVRMYVCGPTVYDLAHIGNARPVVVFDVLFRLLRKTYGAGAVRYGRNITDIDDKIMAAARANGETIEALTRRTEDAFHADMDALGALRPSVEPRATETIPEMIALIEALIARGHAYAAERHVLFHVPSDPGYGRLSGRDREEMIAGARVDVAPYKRDPADFTLWKPSADDQPGWPSPWGRGRPGWHIECSAMSEKHLGVPFDIHGGGLDLIFPHHENEIAQSTCAHGSPDFARLWMHNGYLVVNGEKMSKSLGNFFTVRELLQKGWQGEAIRLLLLGTHYRQPLDFTEAGLEATRARLDRWYRALARVEATRAGNASDPAEETRFGAALADDLNTPLAISVMDEQATRILGASAEAVPALGLAFRANADQLGFLGGGAARWFKGAVDDAEAAEIEALIQKRLAARAAKQFGEADRIRDALKARGIVLEDGPKGTTWKRAG